MKRRNRAVRTGWPDCVQPRARYMGTAATSKATLFTLLVVCQHVNTESGSRASGKSVIIAG